MDATELLATFTAQIRRRPQPDGPDSSIEEDDHVIRVVSPPGAWNGVAWSDLDDGNADAVIAAQIRRFTAHGAPWEWKYYSYDLPADLPGRLVAAGFTAGPPEALLIARLADLPLDVPPPDGVTVRPVVDEAGVDAMVAVHDQAFGGDNAERGRQMRAALARGDDNFAAVVAYAGDTPICAGRVEFHPGTGFASIWGGGTVPEWRGRGVFRSLVAYRTRLAVEHGLTYLQCDSSLDSQPILRRLGFIDVATTTPYTMDVP